MKNKIIDYDKKVLVIVDANSFVHSSFHGYKEKLDKKGNDQRILYGIMDALVSFTYELERIDQLIVVFDPSDGALYRESQYPLYKKNRPPTDPELSKQKNAAQIILRDKIGIPTVTYPGYEADDIIGSLAKMLNNQYQIVIISPDKDIAQVVDKNIFMMKKWRTKTEKGYLLMDEKTVQEEYGVSPEKIPDWLALMGDKVDNLPGIEDVGKAKAAEILSLYPSIEHLLSNLEYITNEKLRKKIIDAKDTLPLIKKLATIVVDLPLQKHYENAINYSNEIMNHQNYNENFIKLERYFNWPSHYKQMFAN